MTISFTGLLEILLLILFCYLSFWRPNAIMFMMLSCIAVTMGLSAPDILSGTDTTTSTDLAFGVSLVIFGFLCAGWSFKLMYWKEPEIE